MRRETKENGSIYCGSDRMSEVMKPFEEKKVDRKLLRVSVRLENLVRSFGGVCIYLTYSVFVTQYL